MYRSETALELVERVEARPDPYIFLGNVKLHLSNKIMEAGDVSAWYICDDAQRHTAGFDVIRTSLDAHLESRGGCDYDA